MKEIYIVVTNVCNENTQIGSLVAVKYASEDYEKCKAFVDKNKKRLHNPRYGYTREDYDTFIKKVILESKNDTILGGYIE